MKTIKTYLFENAGLATKQTQDWADSIDEFYKEIDTEPRNYMRHDDLHMFAMLINPSLENILTSSEFPTIMPHEACKSFGKKVDFITTKFYQLEYFAWLIYEAVGFRKKKGINPLTIHINYKGEDFLSDLREEKWERDTITWLMLMLRQSEGHIQILLYSDYKLINTLVKEDDLKLNKK